MPRLVQVVGIYALPAALEVTPSCFAKRFQAKIGSLNVRVVLPHIEWEDDRPRITMPPMDPGVAQRLKFFIDNHHSGAWFYWGRVSKCNPSKRKILRARLSAILLECKLDPKRTPRPSLLTCTTYAPVRKMVRRRSIAYCISPQRTRGPSRERDTD